MVNKIYSKKDGSLIASIIRLNDIKPYRTDISPESEFIQVSGRILEPNTYVKPHKHKPIKRETTITQECWIVLSGKIQADIYDIDDSKLDSIVINHGDCMVFFKGGHSLLSLEEDTIFYEIKNGPYYGYENDKEDI
jgi:cupin fold WbuC family metalloprotein